MLPILHAHVPESGFFGGKHRIWQLKISQ